MPTVPAKLLRTLAISVVLVLVGNVLADGLNIKYWLPGVTGTPSRIFAFLRAGKPVDVVVLGSSRSVQGVIPRVIEEECQSVSGESLTAYNLAMAGNGLSTAAILLRDVISTCGCPEAVLLEMSPRALDQESETVDRALEYHASLGDSAAGLAFVRTPDNIDALGWGLLRGYLNIVLWVAQPPWTELRRGFSAQWLERAGSPYAYPDLGRAPESVCDWSKTERLRRLRRSPLGKRASARADITYGGFGERALDGTIDLARDCGSRVVVWTSPTTADYAALYRPAEREQFAAVLAGLAGREGVEVFDVEGRQEFEDGDFLDLTHLNSRGAVKLSRMLARRLCRQ